MRGWPKHGIQVGEYDWYLNNLKHKEARYSVIIFFNSFCFDTLLPREGLEYVSLV